MAGVGAYSDIGAGAGASSNESLHSLMYEMHLDFEFNNDEEGNVALQNFLNSFPVGLEGEPEQDWPEEFNLGDYPFSSFKVVEVMRGEGERHSMVTLVLECTSYNDRGMNADDFKEGVMEDVDGLMGVDADNWQITRANAIMPRANYAGGNRRRRSSHRRRRSSRRRSSHRRRRIQMGGDAAPMPASYLGKIPGMIQPDARAGQDMALPNERTVRPFLPEIRGGFNPSVMEPFARSAAQYVTPLALYSGYKLLSRTKKTSRRTRNRKRKASRKNRRN